MSKLVVVDRSGAEHAVDWADGVSAMEAIRDGGVDELVALCGGSCSCATCHVYLEPEAFAQFPAVSEDEDELLNSSAHRTAMSRLSCQLRSPAAAEVRVTIAPED